MAGASFSHAQGGGIWPDGSWHARPPAASASPTNPALVSPRPATLFRGRLRWLYRLHLAVPRHATVLHRGRVAGPAEHAAESLSDGSRVVGRGSSPAAELDVVTNITLHRGSSGSRIWPSTAWRRRGNCRGDGLALLCFLMSVCKEVYEEPRRTSWPPPAWLARSSPKWRRSRWLGQMQRQAVPSPRQAAFYIDS